MLTNLTSRPFQRSVQQEGRKVHDGGSFLSSSGLACPRSGKPCHLLEDLRINPGGFPTLKLMTRSRGDGPPAKSRLVMSVVERLSGRDIR